MLCAGASEQAVSQWASTFAEKGLHIQKTVGDLVGPMLFSVLMGLSRLIYGKYGEKFNLDRFMKGSCVLCVASYLCIFLVPVPIVGLISCATVSYTHLLLITVANNIHFCPFCQCLLKLNNG